MMQTTKLDLFAGIPVADYAASFSWYERLLGSPPSFFPHDTEAVWELAEHRYLYIVQQPEHAGHARLTLFVEDLDALVAQIAERGLDPVKRETYSNGVRKITYHDPDGNEIGLGGAPGKLGESSDKSERGEPVCPKIRPNFSWVKVRTQFPPSDSLEKRRALFPRKDAIPIFIHCLS